MTKEIARESYQANQNVRMIQIAVILTFANSILVFWHVSSSLVELMHNACHKIIDQFAHARQDMWVILKLNVHIFAIPSFMSAYEMKIVILIKFAHEITNALIHVLSKTHAGREPIALYKVSIQSNLFSEFIKTLTKNF
jgi:hypothetical protein